MREVGPVHRETRDDLAHGGRQRLERVVAEQAVALAQAVEDGAEDVDVVGQRQAHGQPLFLVDQRGKMHVAVDEFLVRLGEIFLRVGVHEKLRDVRGEIVPRGAVDGPVLAQFLVAGEDFFAQQVEAAPVVGQRQAAQARVVFLERGEILARVIQTVRVVDAHAGDLFLCEQLPEELVGGLEDLRQFHADGGQRVDVEKAAVVDLLRRHAPIAQAVGLRVDERVERVEGTRVARRALDAFERVGDGGGDGRLVGREFFQPHLGDLFFAGAFGDARGVGLGAQRHVLQLRHDALQFGEIRVATRGRADGQGGGRGVVGLQLLQRERENLVVRARVDGQAVRVVVQVKTARLETDGEFALFEHAPVLVAEDGQEHLVVQLTLERVPVDVETLGGAGAGAVFEHIHPPAVGRLGDAHVVGHEIGHEAHAVFLEFGAHRVELLRGTHFRVEVVVIDDVVAVRAAGAGLEKRRAVEVRDAQRGEVRDDLARLVEGEPLVKLDAVGRGGNARRGRWWKREAWW